MDFAIPPEIESYLAELDAFIERHTQRTSRLDDEIDGGWLGLAGLG